MSTSRYDELKASAHILANENNQNVSAIHFFLSVLNDVKAVEYLLQNGFDDLDNKVKELMMILPEKDNRESAQIDIHRSCLSLVYYGSEFLERHKLDKEFYDPVVIMFAALNAIYDMNIDEIYDQKETHKRILEFIEFVEDNYVPALDHNPPEVKTVLLVNAQVAADQKPTAEQFQIFMQAFSSLLATHFQQSNLTAVSSVTAPRVPPQTQQDSTPLALDDTGVQPVFATVEERETYRHLDDLLAARVIAQDAAVQALTKSVRQVKAGLREKDKTQGAFIFTGPTGVGKTELAKAFAEILDRPLVRFDMSEYAERFEASRLIGAPPGYIGFDLDGGALHKVVRQNPNAVLLLDEIEKAHPDVYNVFLQVMDNGKLELEAIETKPTQGLKGTKRAREIVDFSGVTLIMTTNAGAADAERSGIGFGAKDFNAEAQDEALKKFFSPEFRNRLDGIIPFHHLNKDAMREIVNKFLTDLSRNEFAARGIRADFSDAAREWMVEKGYDPAFGARPLKRVISTYLKDPLADRILFGDLIQGGDIIVDVAADGRSLVLEKAGSPGLTVH